MSTSDFCNPRRLLPYGRALRSVVVVLVCVGVIMVRGREERIEFSDSDISVTTRTETTIGAGAFFQRTAIPRVTTDIIRMLDQVSNGFIRLTYSGVPGARQLV